MIPKNFSWKTLTFKDGRYINLHDNAMNDKVSNRNFVSTECQR